MNISLTEEIIEQSTVHMYSDLSSKWPKLMLYTLYTDIQNSCWAMKFYAFHSQITSFVSSCRSPSLSHYWQPDIDGLSGIYI